MAHLKRLFALARQRRLWSGVLLTSCFGAALIMVACNTRQRSNDKGYASASSASLSTEKDETCYRLNDCNVVVKRFPTGLFNSNSYVVRVRQEGFIVDAGANDEGIFSYISHTGTQIRYIFVTHAHVDHLAYGMLLKDRTGAKLAMHEADLGHLNYYTPERIRSLIHEGQMRTEDVPLLRRFLGTQLDIPLHGGEHFELLGLGIEVLHTPGHSAGSVCFFVGNSLLFSGDTLFPRSFGRTDLDSGNRSEIFRSLQLLLTTMPDEVALLPGHGNTATLREAKEYVGPLLFLGGSQSPATL